MGPLNCFRQGYLDELQKIAVFDPGTITAASTAALALMTGYGKAYKLGKKLKARLSGKISDIKLKLKKQKKLKGIAPSIGTVAKEVGKGLTAAPVALSEDIASVT